MRAAVALIFKFMNYKKWLANNTSSLKGKTVAISGSTGGIGRELCTFLCLLSARLILIDRSQARSDALRAELLAKFPSASISAYYLDLEDVSAVRKTAEALQSEEIDYLVLNAGAYKIPRSKGENGFENVFNINFVSPYILADALLPQIKARGGRVVAVGSIAHNYSKIDVRDVDFSTRNAPSKIYGNAKRYLMYSLWSREEYCDTVNVAHPGITVTNITSHYPKAIYAIIKYPMKLIFMPPRKACLSILYGLFTDTQKNEWIGPRLFDVWGLPKKRILKTCSQEEAKTISELTKEIYLK
jgi:NAD(P)-dependent dehydrogenase (short-subunit alcohol dehydrogenase family)